MQIQIILVFLAGLGLILLLIFQWVPKKGQIKLSNTSKPSRNSHLLTISWFISLALAITLANPTSIVAVIVIFILIMWIGYGWQIVFSNDGRLGHYLSSEKISKNEHVVTDIHYWTCYVESSRLMKKNNTYLLKLGFIEQGTRIARSAKNAPLTDIEIRNIIGASLPKFKEEAIIENENLKDNHEINVKISAPAFTFDSKEYKVNIDELARIPITIPCIPNQKGEHYLVFDFYDTKNQRHGGITIPLEVRDKEPIFSEENARSIQILGGVVGLVSAIVLIVEKVRPYFLK